MLGCRALWRAARDPISALRVAACTQIHNDVASWRPFIYLIAALVILEAANVTDLVASADLARNAVWALAGFFGIGVAMNAISRSMKERRMALVALPLSALSVIVALGV